MKKLLDARYVEHEHTATWLARLVYPIGVRIEEKQPATALKLLNAVYSVRSELSELASPLMLKSPQRKKQRATAALGCVRAVLRRLAREHEEHAAEINAAGEVAERLSQLIATER